MASVGEYQSVAGNSLLVLLIDGTSIKFVDCGMLEERAMCSQGQRSSTGAMKTCYCHPDDTRLHRVTATPFRSRQGWDRPRANCRHLFLTRPIRKSKHFPVAREIAHAR